MTISLSYCYWNRSFKFLQALDTFNTAVISPVYYVMFTTFTIIASMIMFKVSFMHFLSIFHIQFRILYLCYSDSRWVSDIGMSQDGYVQFFKLSIYVSIGYVSDTGISGKKKSGQHRCFFTCNRHLLYENSVLLYIILEFFSLFW